MRNDELAESLGLHRRDPDDTTMWCLDGEPMVWWDGYRWWKSEGTRPYTSESAALAAYTDRAQVAALGQATPATPTVEERLAARCGLVRGEDDGQDWLDHEGDLRVWRSSDGRAWRALWVYSRALWVYSTERDALVAYAEHRGVDVSDLVPPPTPAETPDARALRQVREVLEQAGHLVSSDLAESVQHVVELAQRRVPPPQPAPVGGRGDVWVDVIQHLDEMDLPASLRAKCEARRELGLQRYGVLLGYDDGRDPVRDLEEELLDGAAYAWRLGLRRLTRDLLRFAANPELADVELREADDQLDQDMEQVHRISEIMHDIPPGPYVERVRALAQRGKLSPRERAIAETVLDGLDEREPVASDVLRALLGVPRG